MLSKGINNLAVALLNQGKLKEVSTNSDIPCTGHLMHTAQSIEMLETALKASPSSVVVVEPFLFNLCKLPYCVIQSIGCSTFHSNFV
jgi:hypothetical protein